MKYGIICIALSSLWLQTSAQKENRLTNMKVHLETELSSKSINNVLSMNTSPTPVISRITKNVDNKTKIKKPFNPIQIIRTVKFLTKNMVLIKGGTFRMGNINKLESTSKPMHKVTLSSYYINRFEVTTKQWNSIMKKQIEGSSLNEPIKNITWSDVQIFIQKLNKLTGQNFRLPTESEWEYASRGGVYSKNYNYSGSNNIKEVAVYNDFRTIKLSDIGSKKPNELGLFDMSGNVSEWCSDWFGYYSDESKLNPKGPSDGTSKIIRGGGWNDYVYNCKNTFRGYSNPEEKSPNIGFRLVLEFKK